jgi:RNA polymerase sigma-32 factor
MSNSLSFRLYQDSELQRYLKNISKIQMLSKEEEYNLALEVYNNQDKQSAQKLIISHLPLVVKIAYSYKGYGLSISDLISEGNIGLIRAVAKFDPLKGNRLSTYASFWIKAFITDYILNSWSLVRVGTISARKKLFFSLNKIKNKLGITNHNLTEQNIKAIANEVDVSRQDVIDINNMIVSKDLYLQSSVYQDSSDSMTFDEIIANNENNPEQDYANKENTETISKILSQAFEVLNDREKEILKLRYLIENTMTLEEIGEKLNLSRERVRQVEKLALEKAKKFVLNKYKHLPI